MASSTKTQAMLDWFHGRTPKPTPTPDTDVREAFFAGWDAREDAASRAQVVKKEIDAPEVVRWVEATTMQPRVSLPASDYDELRVENERLRVREEVAKAMIEGSEKEIERLRAELRGYEWGLSNANAEEHDIRES